MAPGMSRDESSGVATARVQKFGSTGSRREPAAVPHLRRFRLGIVALAVIGLVALGVALGLATGGRATPARGDWSSWQPTDQGLAGAQEIADYVAPYYRASPSTQLAVVTAVNLNDPKRPIEVAVPASGSKGSLVPLPANSTIVYNLCGVGGQNCSIGVGHPSSARLLLLKREALELALYTFKYISGANYVVALLPPGRTPAGCTGICPHPHTAAKFTASNLGLVFLNSELQPWLTRPLSFIFPEVLPPTVSQMPTSSEAELVSILTAHGLFQAHVEQGQDGSSVVLLTPTPPQ